jgi:hypothetical protein
MVYEPALSFFDWMPAHDIVRNRKSQSQERFVYLDGG